MGLHPTKSGPGRAHGHRLNRWRRADQRQREAAVRQSLIDGYVDLFRVRSPAARLWRRVLRWLVSARTRTFSFWPFRNEVRDDR